MGKGSMYDRDVAALGIKQARGDLIEAIFLVRAYRTSLPRFGAAAPIDTAATDIRRRISATFKDLPGGQVLGPTFDYTHRLLDPTLADGEHIVEPASAPQVVGPMPRVTDLLASDDLIEQSPDADPAAPVGDLTRDPLAF